MAATALIADHDASSRDILRRAIAGLVRIVGEVDSDETAIVLARALEPDLILIDLDLPKAGGIPTARQIKAEQPLIGVILMTAHGEEAFLEATGRGGADAFLPKRQVRSQAPAVLRRVAGGVLRPWAESRERHRG